MPERRRGRIARASFTSSDHAGAAAAGADGRALQEHLEAAVARGPQAMQVELVGHVLGVEGVWDHIRGFIPQARRGCRFRQPSLFMEMVEAPLRLMLAPLLAGRWSNLDPDGFVLQFNRTGTELGVSVRVG